MSKVQPEDSVSKVVKTLRGPLDAAQVKLRTSKSFKKMVCELCEKCVLWHQTTWRLRLRAALDFDKPLAVASAPPARTLPTAAAAIALLCAAHPPSAAASPSGLASSHRLRLRRLGGPGTRCYHTHRSWASRSSLR